METSKEFKLSNGLTAMVARYQADLNAYAIKLFDNGMPLATVTTFVEGFDYVKGWVTVKDYTENEGIVEKVSEMFKDGIEPLGYVASGFVKIPIFELKDKYQI